MKKLNEPTGELGLLPWRQPNWKDDSIQVLTPLLLKIGVPEQDVDDLAVAIRACIAGGVAAGTHYGEGLEIRNKKGKEPVTAADHASNRAIVDLLREERPQDPLLSEESPAQSKMVDRGRIWIVDPLDGTKEFIAQNGEFSIMIGLAREGRAFLGAVYQPTIGRVFVGLTDRGAWSLLIADGEWNVDRLEVDPGRMIRGPLRFVRSRSHSNERLVSIARELGDIKELISGSVGIKCALVARGAADLYVHPTPYLKEWDTCAPEAILRGAGGLVTDCAGEPLSYGDSDPRQHGGIFAATPAAWHRAGPLVRKITRSMFANVPES